MDIDGYSFHRDSVVSRNLYLVVKGEKLEGRIKGVKYSLDQVAIQFKIAENPIDEDLRRLSKERKDVQAVKVARETLGLSLIEGKKYVNALKIERLL
jgi:hypothetical protein